MPGGGFNVIKKIFLGLKTKGLIWKLFGFRVHKMLLLFKYFLSSRKSIKYNFTFFVEDIVFIPIVLVSLIRIFALPFIGAFFTITIVSTHNSAPFWYFFLYVCLLTCIVNNPSFQTYVKIMYHPLFFKAGLWNVVQALCLACEQIGVTAFGIGAFDYWGTRYMDERAFQRDLGN